MKHRWPCFALEQLGPSESEFQGPLVRARCRPLIAISNHILWRRSVVRLRLGNSNNKLRHAATFAGQLVDLRARICIRHHWADSVRAAGYGLCFCRGRGAPGTSVSGAIKVFREVTRQYVSLLSALILAHRGQLRKADFSLGGTRLVYLSLSAHCRTQKGPNLPSGRVLSRRKIPTEGGCFCPNQSTCRA